MTLLDAALGIALILLCAHLAAMLVQLVGALVLWRRRDPSWTTGIAAGATGMWGELLVLGALIGRPTSPAIMLGVLAGSLALSLLSRPTWHLHAAGRLGRTALIAAPLGLLVAAVLLARAV